jgi:tRNA(Ile)-lysidine synthase
MQLIKTIQNFAFQNNLWKKNSKIVLGISGGPDSVCLLDVLAVLSKKYNFKLYIVHINYNLRGKDSQQDELLVRKLAKKYDIKVSVFSPEKSEYTENLENSLREIRYEYFEKIRQNLGFDVIAVAHNQDDQAETVLMRIIRGSGLNGLSAMRAKTGKIIRPLLKTSRKEILAYIKQNKYVYRVDKSNADTKLIRNKIRHRLLPYLEKNFNPAIKKTLSEWSISVADDYAFISENSRKKNIGTYQKEKYCFKVKLFLKQESAIQRQILRNIFGVLKKNMIDIDNKQIEELIKIIKSRKNKNQKAVVGGLNILKKGDKVIINLKKF